MFECSIESVSVLKNIVDMLTSAMEDTVNFLAKPDGFGVIAMDPSHVSMVNFFIPKGAFSTYKCDKKTNIGLNIGNLNRLLKRIGSDEILTIKLSEKENKLILNFKGKVSRTFSVTIVDIEEEEEYPSPKMQTDANAIFYDPNLLFDAIKDSELFSDHINITMGKEKCIVNATGDNGEVSVEIPPEKDVLSLDVKEESKSMYPLSYLSTIMKICPVTEMLKIGFSTEMPILMEFTLKGITEKKKKEKTLLSTPEVKPTVIFFLAPRVESEDEGEESADDSEKGEEEEGSESEVKEEEVSEDT